MLIVVWTKVDDENRGLVFDQPTIYGTCADEDAAIVALVNALAEADLIDDIGHEHCAVAYEHMDGIYETNVDGYENRSYAVLAANWDVIRDRHEWWSEDEIAEHLKLW